MSEVLVGEVETKPETYEQARREFLLRQREAEHVTNFFLGRLASADWISARQFHELEREATGRFRSWIFQSKEEWEADRKRMEKYQAERLERELAQAKAVLEAAQKQVAEANAVAVRDAG